MGQSVDEDLNGVKTSENVDQFKGALEDAHGLLLLTVVAATGTHDHVDKALNKWALDLLELALLIAASSVRNEDLLFDSLGLEVCLKRHIIAGDSVIRPLSEELWFNSELRAILVVIVVLFLDHLLRFLLIINTPKQSNYHIVSRIRSLN